MIFLLGVVPFKGYAQLGFCSGNSGAPIFTESFGSGTSNNFLPPGTTTYNYTSGYPNDGFYTVSNGTFGNGFDWHQTQDHTGDINGKCLIINAASAPGEFYNTTISGLCENTTYEFSSWVINLVRAGSFCSMQPGGTIPINVRFEIWDSTDTSLLASGNTGNIVETSTPNWQEYGLVFQTLVMQNTVILKMINNGQGGCGNDLAIDDIAFKSCGDLSIVQDGANNNDITICGDQTPYSTSITVIPDNSVFLTHFYQWQESNDGIIWTDLSGETNQNLNLVGISNTSYYRSKVSESSLTVNNPQCNTLSDIYTITVNALITPTFTQLAPICNGDLLSPLPTTSNEGITGAWAPALDNTTTTIYTFTPDVGQCAVNQTMSITVNPKVIPTFSQVAPICNGDVLNALPITSNEGITGVWSPTLDNRITTTYTFTPNTGQCSAIQMMTIIVNPSLVPVFNPVPPICSGETLSSLPSMSLNGISGTWSPELDNMVTTTYTFTPGPGFCPSPVNLTITVNENPIFSLQDEYFLCFEQNGAIAFPSIIDTGLNSTTYNFVWLVNGIQIPGANQGTYSPIEGGNYEVIAQNNVTGCSSLEATIVVSLYEPDFEARVTTDAFSKNQTIEVITQSTGVFEYRLDSNSWQDEPFFYNVNIGEHEIKVRDKRGCIESNENIVVMGYPKFFTPNDDGYNDTWNIVAPTSPINYLASAKVFIYNRYGKLLKELNPSGAGWKGIYNGVTMPNDDYWFTVEYNEPNSGVRKQFNAHFTLKR